MKKIMLIAVSLLFLLTGCGGGSENSMPSVEDHEVHENNFAKLLELSGSDINVVSALALSDGGTVIIGNVDDPILERRVLVVRLDADGKPIWAKRISHQGAAETHASRARLSPGNASVYIVGYSVEDIPESSSIRNKRAMWLCEVRFDGSIARNLTFRNQDQWVVSESAADVSFVGSNIILIGDMVRDLGWKINHDLVAICLSDDWQIVWQRRYDSLDYEVAKCSVAIGSKVIITGYGLPESGTNLGTLAVSIDAASGKMLATRSFVSSSASLMPNDMIVSGSELVLAGSRSLYGGLQDAAIWSIDENLNLRWQHLFKEKGTIIRNIVHGASSGFVAAGCVYDNTAAVNYQSGMVMELDASGTPVRGIKIEQGNSLAVILQNAGKFTLIGDVTKDASGKPGSILTIQESDVFKSALAEPLRFVDVLPSISIAQVSAVPTEIATSNLNLKLDVTDVILLTSEI